MDLCFHSLAVDMGVKYLGMELNIFKEDGGARDIALLLECSPSMHEVSGFDSSDHINAAWAVEAS